MNEATKIKSLLASRKFSEAIGAGYSLSATRAAGYSLPEAIGAGYSLSEARAAGYSLPEAIGAGYSLSATRAAGYSLSATIGAGYSASQLQDLENSIPLVQSPYTRIWAGIQDQTIRHNQSTFGPDADPETNLCKTPMCTAGHLVNMGGGMGYALKDKYGFSVAAALIHEKAHPGWPCQNFGSIPQDSALAYIEEMAGHEKKGTSPVIESAS